MAASKKRNKPVERPSKKAAPRGRSQVPCLDCGLCCTYVAVDIDAPTTVKRATQILWYLYHDQISLYWDNDGDWMLQFETRCRNLQPDNRCAVYATRPHICRNFDETSCEVNAEDEGTSFYSAPEFLEFLRTRRKSIYRKLQDGYIPPADVLNGPPADRSRLTPFDKRFRRLRVLGSKASD